MESKTVFVLNYVYRSGRVDPMVFKTLQAGLNHIKNQFGDEVMTKMSDQMKLPDLSAANPSPRNARVEIGDKDNWKDPLNYILLSDCFVWSR